MSNDLFVWDEKYNLKVKAMDDEHKQLVWLMNCLHQKFSTKASPDEQGKALENLVYYTIKHFADEEAYMASLRFAGLETHKLIHKSLLDKLQVFGDNFKKSGVLSEDLFGFLKTWLVAHILGIDTKYAEMALKKPA